MQHILYSFINKIKKAENLMQLSTLKLILETTSRLPTLLFFVKGR
jgi:hypothetical protein